MEKLTRKLFLAISAASLENELDGSVRKLKINADRKELFIRWTPPEKRHITVVFLGETEDALVAAIAESARKIVTEVAPFTLKIEDFGAFPETRSARVLWCGVQNSRKLRFFRDLLSDDLRLKGFVIETEYEPHLTIGRLKNPKSVSDYLSPFVRAKVGKLAVDEIILYESVLAGAFPVYNVLDRFKLSGIDAPMDEC